MTKARTGLFGGLVFVGAQAVSLLANYGFQLLAARKLAPADYVALFGWLAELAAYGVLSIVALNVALTKPASRERLPALHVGGGAVVVAAFAGALLAMASMPLAAVVAVAIAFGYASGAALARQALVLAALASTSVFVVRIGWFVAAPSAAVGERATLLGYAVGLAVLLAGSVVDARTSRRDLAAPSSLPGIVTDVARAVLLSGAQAVAPVADYLLVRGSVPAEHQAAWASGSLLLRVPVVLGMGVLQVTLAKRLAASRTGEPLPRWAFVAEVGMPASLLLAAPLPLSSVLARVLSIVIGGAPSAYAALPFGRMLWSAGATLGVLALLQVAHVRRELRMPAVAAAVVAVGALALSGSALAWETKLFGLATLWTSLAVVLLWRLSHERPGAHAARVRARPDTERGQDARPGALSGPGADAREE